MKTPEIYSYEGSGYEGSSMKSLCASGERKEGWLNEREGWDKLFRWSWRLRRRERRRNQPKDRLAERTRGYEWQGRRHRLWPWSHPRTVTWMDLSLQCVVKVFVVLY